MAGKAFLPVWKSRYRIQAMDADLISLAKVSALCNYFQESAGEHANHLGVGYNDLFNKGLVWILSRLSIQIEAYPIWGEEILLETWPAGIDGLAALRNFTISRSNGQKIIKGSSAWLVLDRETKKPLRDISTLLKHLPDNHFPQNTAFEIPRIKPAEGLVKTLTIPVLYCDLDANAHVNNNRFIEWITNAFDADWYRSKRIHNLTVSFLNELQAGNTLEIRKAQTRPDTWHIEGHNLHNGQVVFRSLASFADYF
jgi:acyl-ACP thioesterase